MDHRNGNHRDAIIGMIKPPLKFIGGLAFQSLTYTVVKKQKNEGKWTSCDIDLLHHITGYAPKGSVTAVMGPSGAGKSTFLDALAGRIASGSLKGRVTLDGVVTNPSLIKRSSAYIMQEDQLFPMLTVYETLMFAADFRLGSISRSDKKQRVEKLIEQLGLVQSRNTYIGDEGTRGVSGGERRRVSIGVDIIHGPSLLFLDEPTSGLDSTSAHNVIEKVQDIAHAGSTVILTIHQPSYRIQLLLDHLIILARGQLMFQGSPKDVAIHLGRMGRKVPAGENAIEYLLDVVQEYDQSNLGVEALADFCLTGMKPPPISDLEMSLSTVVPTPSPSPLPQRLRVEGPSDGGRLDKRLPLHGGRKGDNDFDHSLRSPWSSSRSWTGNPSGVTELLRFSTTSRPWYDRKPPQNPPSLSPGIYTYSNEILPSTLTPHSSDYTVEENDYLTPACSNSITHGHYLGSKFANAFLSEIWVLMRRNFAIIRRTPELFLSRQMVLTIMGFMMATMFWRPEKNSQGITNTLSFIIFTVCLFFFSSNDAVPAFIQERYIFVRETSHNAYRASSYVISGFITYLPFLALQAATYGLIVWWALDLSGEFRYFLIVLYVSLLSTNSFVVFVSSVVPNYILGYAAVIAFTALFFLFCGYFVNKDDIPQHWKWMNWVSTMKYPYEGLLMNQYQLAEVFDKKTNLTGNVILEHLAIDTEESKKWLMVLYMIGWAVFYRVLFYLILRFGSKNQRT